MEIVSAIVGPVVQSLMVHVKQHLGYLICSTKHVTDMRKQMAILEGKSVDVKNHMHTNNINALEVPTRVPGWLKDVEKTKADARRILPNGNECFNMKRRYRAGKNASKTTKDIEGLIQEHHGMEWNNTRIPPGMVNSNDTSTSAPLGGDTQNDYKSRDKTFKEALKFLQQDHKTRVIALCGMGGVGKTTMMEQLKKAVKFDMTVKVVIGQKTNLFSIQKAIAEYTGNGLTEETETARADRLCERFKEISKGGKTKILVILDDVWEMVKLKDIGLSSLPDGFKLLLTSRDERICKRIAVEANSVIEVVKVDVLEEPEAREFFCRITGVLEEHDPNLYSIGNDIVRRCGCLPLAMKLIAETLISEGKCVWEDRLQRLKKNNLDDNVQEIIEISFNYLKDEEDKAVFLLCGLFPEDSNISIEDLTRYAWGLELLNRVDTLGEARNRTITCVRNLKKANLLIDSDYIGCVKMHDLVLAFVVGKVSNGVHPWIINHNDMSKWGGDKISESCERISLTCMGMSEFPRDFKYPNLLLLKLMHGDKSLRFPEDFYANMKKNKVIAYEKIQYPLLHKSFQCLTNLRTLCLQHCLLMDDLSLVGSLVNLEVLSFAHCHIRKLSSAIGKLKKLKLLDLTGCVHLCIDDGVLKNLENLEELYMRVADRMPVCFTDGNCNELTHCSKNLSALEFEFFKNNVQPKDMSFKKLERFKISMGCYLDEDELLRNHSFENTLNLVTKKDELLKSGMNELFTKAEALDLEVNDMDYLEDVLMESQQTQSLFSNLRVLKVNNCSKMEYLFTIRVASGLTKLEELQISCCNAMEVLVHSGDSGADQEIKFQKLKFLSLSWLPKLKSLCNRTNVIKLPELTRLKLVRLPCFTSIYPPNKSSPISAAAQPLPFLNKEVVVPKLENLDIREMGNLEAIWPCQITRDEEVNVSMLRYIKVDFCDSLVNLFPSNPMSLLQHLEELEVGYCGSIEVLFNIDCKCVGEIEKGSSKLRHIIVETSKSLTEVWRMINVNNHDLPIRGFQNVEEIEIGGCGSFRSVFTPTTVNFDMGALRHVYIQNSGNRRGRNSELVGSSEEEEINVISKKQEISEEVDDIIPNVAFPSQLMHTFHHLQEVDIRNCNGVEVVFDMESASSRELATTRNNQQPLLLLPDLKDLYLYDMKRMSHVWKCNWNKFLIPQKQPPESSFHNLTSIELVDCHNIKYLFSPLMAKLLSNLKDVRIHYCDGIEEVVSNRDDENEEMTTSTSTHTSTALFPHLDTLHLKSLKNLKRIGGDKGGSNEISLNNTTTTTSTYDAMKCSGVASWSLCQYSRQIYIEECHKLSSVIPSHAIGQLQKLEELEIVSCKSVREVFESKRVDNYDESVDTGNTLPLLESRRLTNMIVHKLPYLKRLVIDGCDLLEHIFIFSTLESLKQLKELTIKNCKAMKVIVKEDEEHTTKSKVVVFHHLMSLTLADLPNLEGFFLGMNEFEWSLLDKVEICNCPQMIKFTSGQSKRSQVDDASWSSCPCSKKIEIHSCGLSSVFPSHAVGQLEKLEVLDIHGCDLLEHIFVFSILESLKQLKELTIKNCKAMKVIVKEDEEHTTTSKVVVFHRLMSLTLEDLPNLECFFLGMNEFEWSLLDKVEIRNCPQMIKFTSGQSKCSQGGDFSWSLCPYSKKIHISHLHGLSSMFPSHAVGQLEKLEELKISRCNSMMDVFEIEGVNNDGGPNTNVDNGSGDSTSTMGIFPRLTNTTLLKLSNLKILQLFYCGLLQHVFTFSTLESLKQLEKLRIENCEAMKVIVKEEKGEHTTTSKDVVFPRLQSLELVDLPNLDSFFSGKNDFQWPLLDMVKIKGCPQMMRFTHGHSTALGLKYIHTSLGKYSLDCGLTFQVAANTLHQAPFSSLGNTSSCPTSEEIPWRFSNLIEIDMEWISNVKKIIPSSNKLLQLQKLEKIQVYHCDDIVEVFEALNETSHGFNASQFVVTLPNLTRVSIYGCKRLEHVFTCSMVGSLLQLQELHINDCESMEVIVEDANVVLEEKESGAKPNEITLRCLKSLKLEDLPSFKGFFLGNEAFSFPSLDTLEIKKCPKITVFTNGHLATPKLNEMRTRFGMRYVRDDLNSCIKTEQQEGRLL